MKKLLIVSAAVAGVVILGGIPRAAAQVFELPVPIVSGDSQVGKGADPTKADATHLKFFIHPEAAWSPANFKDQQGVVKIKVGAEEQTFAIDDIAATPGLLPREKRDAGNNSKMVDEITSRVLTSTIDPIQGFCPEAYHIKSNGPGNLETYLAFDCQLGKMVDKKYAVADVTDRQFVVADIRNALKEQEFNSTMAGMPGIPDPVLTALGIVGNADEELPPYASATYPALVKRSDDFASPIQVDGKFEAIAYDVADLTVPETVGRGAVKPINRGLVTAVYDPVLVDLIGEMTMGYKKDMQDVLISGMAPQMTQMLQFLFSAVTKTDKCSDSGTCAITMPFSSPLAFFRADEGNSNDRMRLGGYSSMLQIPKPDKIKDPQAILAGVMGQNFNPIAVEAMRYPHTCASPPAIRQAIPQVLALCPPVDGFAVVNQATIGDVRKLGTRKFLWPIAGNAIPAVPVTLELSLGIKDGQNPFQPLDPTMMPHKIASYAVFWSRGMDPETGRPVVWGPGSHAEDTLNPNYVYDPFVLSLVGPGMFDAEEGVDKIGGQKVHALYVPSGEAAANDQYYVYKIDPIRDQRLVVHFAAFDAQGTPIDDNSGNPIEMNVPVPVVLPDAYPIDVPAGFAPYQVKAADFNGDGCSDIALTFRGAQVVQLDEGSPFTNDYGQHVVFHDGATKRAFSNEVRVYDGIPDEKAGKCKISQKPSKIFTPAADAQIAAIAIANFDGNGGDDLMAGDLIVRAIANGPDADKFAAHAYLFPGMNESPVTMKTVRAGYAKTGISPVADPVGYLLAAMQSDKGGLVGVSAIDANQQGPIANAAFINGTPLMLPPFGCPKEDNIEVISLLESKIARMFTGKSIPQRCREVPEAKKCTQKLKDGTEVEFPFTAAVDDPGQACCRVPCESVCQAVLQDVAAKENTQVCGQAPLGGFEGICKWLQEQANCPTWQAEGVGAPLNPGMGAQNDTDTDDGSAEGGEERDSEFASAWRPDVVVGEDGHGIISMGALKEAQAINRNLGGLSSGQRVQAQDQAGSRLSSGFRIHPNVVQGANVGAQQFNPPVKVEPAQQVINVPDVKGKIIPGLGAPQADEIKAIDPNAQPAPEVEIKPVPNVGKFVPDKDVFIPQFQPEPPNENAQPAIGKVKRPPPRFARGHVMPGHREMTVLVNTTLSQKWECNPHGPLAEGAECNLDNMTCDEANGEVCQMNCTCHASCSDVGGPLQAGWGCNKDNPCTSGHVCTVKDKEGGCACVPVDNPPPPPPPPGVEEKKQLVNDCTCRVLTDPSNELKEYRQRLNKEYISDPANRPDYEALVFHEHKIQCVCSADNAVAADGSILPSKTVKFGGAVPSDFVAKKEEFKWTAIKSGQPLQLLPIEGGAVAAKAQSVAVDLSGSADAQSAVLFSSYDITPTVSVGSGHAVDIENVFHYNAFAAGPSGGSFTIAAGEPGAFDLAAPNSGAFFEFTMIAAPACPSFTAVDGYVEGCFQRESWDTMKALKEAKDVIASRAAGGNKSSIFTGIDAWEPIYNNQFNHVQAKLAVAADPSGNAAAGIEELKFAVLAGDYLKAEGGGCGCVVGNATPDASSLVQLLLAAAGLGVLRIARRRK